MSKYANTRLDIVSTSGGSNRVTIPADPFQIRGGTGDDGATSVPCKEAWLSCPKGSSGIKVNIGTTCEDETGIRVPEQGIADENEMYLRIPIDDLNKLYFVGTLEDDVIDILYRE